MTPHRGRSRLVAATVSPALSMTAAAGAAVSGADYPNAGVPGADYPNAFPASS